MTTLRRPGTTSAAVLFTLTGALIAAHLIAPEWSRRVGLDVWNYAAAEEDCRSATDERAEMDAKEAGFHRRRVAADGTATRLTTGQADLATVALQLLDLLGSDEGSRTTLQMVYPNLRDVRLLYARHALDRVSRLLPNDPARCAAVRARLEAEYRALEARWAAPN